jgi:hypothetical protein
MRSTSEVLRYLTTLVKNGEAQPTEKIRVTVRTEDKEQLDVDGNELVILLAEGTVEEVINMFVASTIPPQLAVFDLHRRIEFMASHSSLKGVLLTMVFGDAEISGLGYISTVANITEADVITLVEGAKNQVEMFKAQMKKQVPEMKFPSDAEESNIIVPAHYRK